jgi:tRNA nucleotidyltransferase (CCA-adding enzyme)
MDMTSCEKRRWCRRSYWTGSWITSPLRVVLFGSRARDESGPDSDIDLLVILDDDAPADKLTLRAGWESRRGFD